MKPRDEVTENQDLLTASSFYTLFTNTYKTVLTLSLL
jgi:hypothetical protein